MQTRLSTYLAIIILLTSGPIFAAPSIGTQTTNLTDYSGSIVPMYEKFELTFAVGNVGTAFTDYNPFNPNLTALGSQYYNIKGIKVEATLTSPSARVFTWPAFWYRASDGSTCWKVRFSPTETGTWKWKVVVRYGADTVSSNEHTFACGTGTAPGFVRINASDSRFFQFTDGSSFYPVGCNVSGYDATPGTTAWGTAFPKMKAVGANFGRVFFTSLNIEPYNVNSDKSALKALNNYDMGRALTIDTVLDTAHTNGVYLEWCIDDQTYLKDQSSQYISATGRAAPCATFADFFTSADAKEIYKRKLRYWMARWGYSPNLVNIEFINETGESGSGTTAAWHQEMGNYIHSFTDQPHLASGSNGSGELRVNGVPWNDPSMDYVNYHDYAKYTQGWSIKTTYGMETLGSTLQFPWQDFAVYAERLARMATKRYKWNKPICWTEFGLIYRRPGDSGFPDWDLAYQKDANAHHVADGVWAGMLSGMSITHWKLDYILGKYGGGEKFFVYAPLTNYLKGEDFVGLTQTTSYPVADPLNTSPKVTCTNPALMVVAMHGNQKAYFYVKNLTDTWFYQYYNAQTTDRYADPTKIPTPSAQSGTVKVAGMTPGQYILECWSTSDTNPATQITSKTTITVGSDGIATVSASSIACGAAFKIKPASAPQPAPAPSLRLTMTADKQSAAPGTTITYTVTYTNSGGTATNAVISVIVPSDATFVSASNSGVYSSATKKVSWTLPSIAEGATGSVTFQARIN